MGSGISSMGSAVSSFANSIEEKMWVDSFRADEAKRLAKYDRLKDIDLLILDNSVRESTVGQLRGHTAEDKFKIYEEAAKCGFKEMLVGSFSHLTRVDDDFICMLIKKAAEKPNAKEIIGGLWAFSEVADYQVSKKQIPNEEAIPIGMKKMKQLGFFNVIFEVDLGDSVWNYNEYSIEKFTNLIKTRMEWCHENCPWAESTDWSTAGEQSKLLHDLYEGKKPEMRFGVNLRDLPESLAASPERVYKVVDFLTSLPEEFNLFAVAFEDSTGNSTPEATGGWAKFLRQILDKNKSKARLLVHIHERYGMSEASVLQALMEGADGLWSNVAAEGAFIGQAATSITMINLIRMGNKKILERYNCRYLRKAAINVTQITTGLPPPKRQPVFGPRSIDIVFGSQMGPSDGFDLADFFEEKAPVRLTTMANEEMILHRLETVFGEDPAFTLEVTKKMREQLLDDLRSGVKEEYMSPVGLAMLFGRADNNNGQITPCMAEMIADQTSKMSVGQSFIDEARKRWDEFDAREDEQKDEMLEFDSFYNAFMAPWFSCYRCADAINGLKVLDMDSDGKVDWHEFKVYLIWAWRQYPDQITSLEDMLEIAFTKGLIPCMQEETTKRQNAEKTEDKTEEKTEEKTKEKTEEKAEEKTEL